MKNEGPYFSGMELAQTLSDIGIGYVCMMIESYKLMRAEHVNYNFPEDSFLHNTQISEIVLYFAQTLFF